MRLSVVPSCDMVELQDEELVLEVPNFFAVDFHSCVVAV
jgi:hypothetical protein